MITGYDLTKDVRYQQGIEKGYKQGIEQGIEQGIYQGIEQGKMLAAEEKNREFVTSLIVNFPELSDEKIASISATTIDFVKTIRQNLGAGNVSNNGKNS